MMGTTMGTIWFAIHGDPDRYRTAIGIARTRSKIAKGLAIPDGLKGEMRCCCWGGFVLGRQVSRKAAEAAKGIFRFEWVEQKNDQMKRSMEEDMLMFRF
ncbi:hypothetical protein Tco_0879957 [Tanacetum coccineum]